MKQEQVTEAVEELQIKVAFQEDTIQQLNTVITKQQFEIDRLSQQVSVLVEKIQSLNTSENRFPHEEPPPPHF